MKNSKFLKFFIIFLLTAFYLRELIYSAWLCDDSAITLRSVLNFVNGYGMRFNVDERVQTFTHPLWFFVLSFNAIFIKDIFCLLYVPCIFFSLFTFIIYCFFMYKNEKVIFFFSCFLLFTSRCFIDFSTSGLENSLSYFLSLLCFIFSIMFFNNFRAKYLFFFTLSYALLCLNRLDYVLIFLPLFLYIYFISFKNLKCKNVILSLILGIFPLFAWHIFSLIYYGFLFPNTAYAKLVTDITFSERISRGLNYFNETLHNDPLTFIVIFLFLILSFKKSSHYKLISLGILFYLIYIIYIGGDFMGGRFFSVIFLLTVANFSYNYKDFYIFKNSFIKYPLLLFFIYLASFNFYRTILSNEILRNSDSNFEKINDERGMYQHENNLIIPRGYNEFVWKYDENSEIKVLETERLGWYSLQQGANAHMIDKFALSDAFLARIEGDSNYNQNGHYSRLIPEVYIKSVQENTNLLKNDNIREFYDLIKLVTKGKLFSKDRFIAIYKLNTQKYNFKEDEVF